MLNRRIAVQDGRFFNRHGQIMARQDGGWFYGRSPDDAAPDALAEAKRSGRILNDRDGL